MKKFFANIDSLHQFTLTLDAMPEPAVCPQCRKTDQFVSHGFIYKRLNLGKRQTIGKRIFCSNRSGRSGCGSTCQLYISQTLPSLQYNALHLFVFLRSLIASFSIQVAYQKATGTLEPRNAYRWLNKLQNKLIDYRVPLRRPKQLIKPPFQTRTKRLQLLLSTLSNRFKPLNDSPCAHYQMLTQTAFI